LGETWVKFDTIWAKNLQSHTAMLLLLLLKSSCFKRELYETEIPTKLHFQFIAIIILCSVSTGFNASCSHVIPHKLLVFYFNIYCVKITLLK